MSTSSRTASRKMASRCYPSELRSIGPYGRKSADYMSRHHATSWIHLFYYCSFTHIWLIHSGPHLQTQVSRGLYPVDGTVFSVLIVYMMTVVRSEIARNLHGAVRSLHGLRRITFRAVPSVICGRPKPTFQESCSASF